MLIIENQEHFDRVREFARSVGAGAELQRHLDFLAGFGGDFLRAASGLELTGDVLASHAMPFQTPCARQLALGALGVRALRPVNDAKVGADGRSISVCAPS